MYFQLYDILEKAKLLLQKAYKRFLGPRVGLGIDKKKKKRGPMVLYGVMDFLKIF